MSAPGVTLTLSADHHRLLQACLFPDDGGEAVAIALCGRRAGLLTHRLLVREVYPVPLTDCDVRSPRQVTWRCDSLVPLLERAEAEGLALVKVHSHRLDFREFSSADTAADAELFPCVAGWTGSAYPHGSAVMLSSGTMFGRAFWPGQGWMSMEKIVVVGPDLHCWSRNSEAGSVPAQAFGNGTTVLMNSLAIGVVGCSGTGSIVVEQLARLGVGRLVLVDDDRMEERNLGRVLNAGPDDAENGRAKVEVIAASIARLAPATGVQAVVRNLWSREAVESVAECDIVFGCMDSHEGRFLLNLLATDYLIPYFDVGVRLDATGVKNPGAVREACGTVHYLLPGGSSLVSRGLVSLDRVREEGLRRRDPTAYRQQREDGYIIGRDEQRPAVISVNMFAASLAVNDFLARLHPYREEPNARIASIEFSLASLEFFCEEESEPCRLLEGRSGQGDREPRLGLTELSAQRPD
jgi:hypothetical protein